ncbi:MAG: hypothetical protein FJ100_03570 [Deltaproteobacteria bacterium]|nr:hypothetical protein [Deltaproteobacteria bacterium]
MRSDLRMATVAIAAATAWPQLAAAGDFERNEVLGRELAAGVAVVPDDIDFRAPGPCPGATKVQCLNQSLAVGPIVRGAARRHRGNLYLGSEVVLGMRVPLGEFSAFPIIGAGAAIGWETAADSYKRLRGYGEFGASLVYSGTRASDLLKFHVEAGLRYRVKTYERPHSYIHIGARVINNFAHFGAALFSGIGWAFD